MRLTGNMGRAVKHWMIAAGTGDDISLKEIGRGFIGCATGMFRDGVSCA